MTEFAFNRWFLEGILKANVCEVKFTRVTGGISTMRCTLKSEYLQPISDKEKLERDVRKRFATDVISVWNLDKKGWRSFKIENLLNLEIIDALPV